MLMTNTEEPIRKEETEADSQVQTSTGFQGGYGSSSLKECIELLNTTSRVTPAPLDSGIGDSAGPPQVMSPNMEKSLTDERMQPSSGSVSQETAVVALPTDGSTSQNTPQVKNEPLSQVKCESVKEIKTESSSSTQEVKVKQEVPLCGLGEFWEEMGIQPCKPFIRYLSDPNRSDFEITNR